MYECRLLTDNIESPSFRPQISNSNGNKDKHLFLFREVLTVIAEWPTEGSHTAVTAETIPLLQAHTLIRTRVLLAGCAGPWKTIQKKLGFF